MIENWRRTRRFDRFIPQYAALLIVVIAVISTSVSALLYLDDQAKRINDLRLDARQLLQLQYNQVTGVRGYDVTSDQRFLLQPYLDARKPLDDLYPSIASRVEKNSEAAEALRDFGSEHERWERAVARPIIAKANDPKNIDRERMSDALMSAAKEDIATIDALYARRYDQVRATRLSIRYVATGVVIIAILLIAWMAYAADRKNLKREESLLRTIMEERDAEARRSEWRTKLIAMLAHDFRSSLGVIRAYTDFLESFPEKRDEAETYETIRKSVDSLAG